MSAIDEKAGLIRSQEIREYREVAKGYSSFRNNDVLFAKITPCMQNGKAAIARDLTGGIGFGSTEFHILRPGPELLPEWVFAFVRYPLFKISAAANFTGTAGQQRVSTSFMTNSLIPVPSLPEQKRIVATLGAAEELRCLREQADKRTMDLIPALFYEMFGDPAVNDHKFNVVTVGSLFSKIRPGTRCGPFGSALKKREYVADGIPVWGIDNVKPNEFTETGSLFITEEKYAGLKNYIVEPGDILISRAGTVGRMCVARPTKHPSIIGTNLIRLSLDETKVIPEYVSSLFTYFGERMGKLRAASDEDAYSFVQTGTLKSLVIPLPPILLQREFSVQIMKVRGMKACQDESRRRLDNLFQSLLDRAFRGEA